MRSSEAVQPLLGVARAEAGPVGTEVADMISPTRIPTGTSSVTGERSVGGCKWLRGMGLP